MEITSEVLKAVADWYTARQDTEGLRFEFLAQLRRDAEELQPLSGLEKLTKAELITLITSKKPLKDKIKDTTLNVHPDKPVKK